MRERVFKQAHVFVVDADSYPVHRDRLFCGVKNPNKFSKRGETSIFNTALFGLYADLKALRIGDTVFFYQMRMEEEKYNRGFRGIFKIKNEPFFDNDDICGVEESVGGLGSANKKVLGKCPHCKSSLSEDSKTVKKKVKLKNGREKLKNVEIYACKKCEKELDFHILPNRVLIEPIKFFVNKENGSEAVIDDNTAYIDRNYIKKNLPILWTMLFRKTYGRGRERSITHILPEESNKLEFIFKDLFDEVDLKNTKPYEKPPTASSIEIPLECDDEGELKIEALLEAWLIENIDKDIPVLSDVIGNPNELEYFGNNVLYGIGGEKVDVLCIHNKNGERTRVTVIELKKGKVKEDAIKQIKDYTKWTSQLVFGEDTKETKSKIQPVVIGVDISDKIIEFAKTAIIETQQPILLEYEVKDNTIKFKKVL